MRAACSTKVSGIGPSIAESAAIEAALEALETLLGMHLKRGIRVSAGCPLGKKAREIRRDRRCGSFERVLLEDVLRDGEEIGLRRAHRFHVRHAHHAQVNLLHDVGHVGGVSHPGEEITPQLLAVGDDEVGD